jgi:hypothetical protein
MAIKRAIVPFKVRVCLYVGIEDVIIELDTISNLCSIGNELQYKSVIWVCLELQFQPKQRG